MRQKLSSVEANDPVLRQAGDFLPVRHGVVVIDKHGDHQPLGRQAEITGHQFPGKSDRLFLEVIAKTEIAKHFEERKVTGGVADIVQVVVLAAGAHAFLRRRGPRIGPFLWPVKTFLNWTMPALVNSNVGSLRGTSGELGTTSCPLRAK